MNLHSSKSVTDEGGIVYVAKGLTAGEQQLEHTEADLECCAYPSMKHINGR